MPAMLSSFRERPMPETLGFREDLLPDIHDRASLFAVAVQILIVDHDRASIETSTTSASTPLASCLTYARNRS